MTKAEEKDTVYYGVEEVREAGKQKKIHKSWKKCTLFFCKGQGRVNFINPPKGVSLCSAVCAMLVTQVMASLIKNIDFLSELETHSHIHREKIR